MNFTGNTTELDTLNQEELEMMIECASKVKSHLNRLVNKLSMAQYSASLTNLNNQLDSFYAYRELHHSN